MGPGHSDGRRLGVLTSPRAVGTCLQQSVLLRQGGACGLTLALGLLAAKPSPTRPVAGLCGFGVHMTGGEAWLNMAPDGHCGSHRSTALARCHSVAPAPLSRRVWPMALNSASWRRRGEHGKGGERGAGRAEVCAVWRPLSRQHFTFHNSRLGCFKSRHGADTRGRVGQHVGRQLASRSFSQAPTAFPATPCSHVSAPLADGPAPTWKVLDTNGRREHSVPIPAAYRAGLSTDKL